MKISFLVWYLLFIILVLVISNPAPYDKDSDGKIILKPRLNFLSGVEPTVGYLGDWSSEEKERKPYF